LQYVGTGANIPALARKITEAELIDRHHWLPCEIAKIPYKDLQIYLIIENQKQASQANRVNIEKAKQQNRTTSNGQMKRSYREV